MDNHLRERIEMYEERVHEKFVVVGEAFRGHMALIL